MIGTIKFVPPRDLSSLPGRKWLERLCDAFWDGPFEEVEWEDSISFSGSGTLTFTSVSIDYAIFRKLGKREIEFYLAVKGTVGGTGTGIYFTLPASSLSGESLLPIDDKVPFACSVEDSGATSRAGEAKWMAAQSAVLVKKYDSSNWATGADAGLRVAGRYRIG